MGFLQVFGKTAARRKMVETVLESPNKGPGNRVYAVSQILRYGPKTRISYAGQPLVYTNKTKLPKFGKWHIPYSLGLC